MKPIWEHVMDKSHYNIFTTTAHPKLEEVFITGSFIGEVTFWDIASKSKLRTFQECGTTQQDIYLPAEIFDGKFTKDGKTLAVCTTKGTFSIYTMYDEESYKATPIEQFIHLRNPNEEDMTFEQKAENQILIKSDFSVHQYQPPYPMLGKFRELKLTPYDYDFNYENRMEVFGREHRFHKHSITEMRTYVIENQIQPPSEIAVASPSDPDNANISTQEDLPTEEQKQVSPYLDDFETDPSDEDFIIEEYKGSRDDYRILSEEERPVFKVYRVSQEVVGVGESEQDIFEFGDDYGFEDLEDIEGFEEEDKEERKEERKEEVREGK